MDQLPYPPPTAASIATLEALSVANIDNPSTELNARAGVVDGAKVICYQAVAGANSFTWYEFDSTSSASVNAPYIVGASGSGQWVACGGKYNNNAVSMASTLAVLGTTASSSSTTGALIVSGGLGVAGNINSAGTAIKLGAGAGAPTVALEGAAGNARTFAFRSGTTNRWLFLVDSGAESGANAGSSLVWRAYDDAGTQIGSDIVNIVRAAGGAFAISRPLSLTDTTASTSTSTGAVLVSGGMGVAGQVSAATLLASGLTTGRVPFITTGGKLTDASTFTWSGTNLSMTSSGAQIILGDGSAATAFYFQGGAGTERAFNFRTGSSNRWRLRANTTAESGANAGSDYEFIAFDDAGSSLGAAMTLTRASRALTLNATGATHTISSTVASTTTTTGALVVSGGVGVAGAVYAANLASSGLTSGRVPTASTAGLLVDDARFTFAGNLLTVGSNTSTGNFAINGTAASNRDLNFQDAGVNRWDFRCNSAAAWQLNARDASGVFIDTPFQVVNASGGTVTLARPVSITSSTASSSSSTGALIVTGGAGIGGALFVGATTGTAFDVGGGRLSLDATNQILSFGNGSGQAVMTAKAVAGNVADLRFQTAGNARWIIRKNGTAEGGANAGSDFDLRALDDTGTYIDSPLTIARVSGGAVTFARPVSVTSSTASTTTATGALIVTGGLGLGGQLTFGGGVVAKVNSGSTINLDITDTAASRTVAVFRVNTSATAHTTAALFDCVSSASTSADKMVRVRANSVDLWTVNADGSAGASGIWSYTNSTASTSTATGAVVISGGLGVAGNITFSGATGASLRLTTATANGSVATTLGSVGPTGSTAGNPQGWLRISVAGTDRFIPFW